MLGYNEWCDIYQEYVVIECAENGADRELDFNLEDELFKRYDEYVTNYKITGAQQDIDGIDPAFPN